MADISLDAKDPLNIDGRTPSAFQEWALQNWVGIEAIGYHYDDKKKALYPVVADQYKFAQNIEQNLDQFNTEHNGRLSMADLQAAEKNPGLSSEQRLLAEAIEENYKAFKQGSSDGGDISKTDIQRFKAANDPAYLQQKEALEKQLRDPQVFATELEKNFSVFDPGNSGAIHYQTGAEGINNNPGYNMEQRVIAEKFGRDVGERIAQIGNMHSDDVTKKDIEEFRTIVGNDPMKIDRLAWSHTWGYGPLALISQPAKECDYYWLRDRLSQNFDMDTSRKMQPQPPWAWLTGPSQY